MKNTKPDYYAFFDVDGTLIKGKPMLDFLRFYYREQFPYSKIIGEIKYLFFIIKLKFLLVFGKKRDSLNSYYYQCYKNQEKNLLMELGERWFIRRIHNRSAYLKNVIDELIAHQNKGAEVVLVSGSFAACLEPFARKFNVQYVLASSLETRNGRYTGGILPPQTIGAGKVKAIQQFLEQNDFNHYERCYAYGDHSSDIPMLSLVGNPKAISGDVLLEQHAKKHGWEIICSN